MYNKLMNVRVNVQKLNLKKSGKNKHLGFDYYELADFLTPATEELRKEGLCPVFTIECDENGIETAFLRIYGENGCIAFQQPTADPGMNNPIQSAGAKNTYMKRYLYMNALELSEYDAVDASAGESVAEKKLATEKQVLKIRSLCDEEKLARVLNWAGVDSVEKLTLQQAQLVIKKESQ